MTRTSGGRTSESAGPGANTSGGDASRIEARILELEEQQRRLEEKMNRAFESGDYRAGRKAGNDLAEVRKRIEELYATWQ